MKFYNELSWSKSTPYYYRFVCENCGCRTHWISREIVFTEKASFYGDFDKAQADLKANTLLEQKMTDTIDQIQKGLDACFAGKRMFVGYELGIKVLDYFGETQCPKCKHVQSWSPRIAKGFTQKKRQKNADEFNATPILSRPDVIIGGESPTPDEPDFKIPCKLEMHGSFFGFPHASPIYLNGIKIGETQNSDIDFSVETYYKDNVIYIYKNTFESYLEVKEGETAELELSNFIVKKKN